MWFSITKACQLEHARTLQCVIGKILEATAVCELTESLATADHEWLERSDSIERALAAAVVCLRGADDKEVDDDDDDNDEDNGNWGQISISTVKCNACI